MATQTASLSAPDVSTPGNKVTRFVQEHQTLLQVVGIGLVSAAGGAWVGLSVAKSWALGQGFALAPTALSYSILPLTVGAAGGGAVGVGVSQRQLRHSKARLLDQIRQTEQAQQEAARLQAALAAAETQLAARPAAPPPVTADALEKISGIGAGYARKLQEAGIHTYADLAAHSAEQVLAIIGGSRTKRLVNPQTWIDQARVLAQQADKPTA